MSKNETQRAKIFSVDQAQSYLDNIQIDNEDLLRICDSIINSESIYGSSSDYHNLAVSVARKGFYLQAFTVVQKGLKLYPYNIDLLADAVYYGSSAGKFSECEEYAKILLSRPLALWNWRAYTFMIDYYMDKTDWLTTNDEILASLASALALSQKAQNILATEERGYLAEYKVHEVLERWYRELSSDCTGDKHADYLKQAEQEHAMANEILLKAIDNNHIAAVQCCLRYADLQFETQNYQETIRICEKAFCYGESQPSAKMGYFLYLAALSMDVLIHQDNAFDDTERVNNCYRMYHEANKTLDADRAVYRSNINLRVSELEARTGISSGLISDSDTFRDLLN